MSVLLQVQYNVSIIHAQCTVTITSRASCQYNTSTPWCQNTQVHRVIITQVQCNVGITSKLVKKQENVWIWQIMGKEGCSTCKYSEKPAKKQENIWIWQIMGKEGCSTCKYSEKPAKKQENIWIWQIMGKERCSTCKYSEKPAKKQENVWIWQIMGENRCSTCNTVKNQQRNRRTCKHHHQPSISFRFMPCGALASEDLEAPFWT